ncbi:MAG TPA: hypothetical protein VF746_28125 [Longimicrobium sp.]|jgi:phenylacetate-coenzyme A ligase PaaK-like adenylate-forming protein
MGPLAHELEADGAQLPRLFRERLLQQSIEHARTRVPAYRRLLAEAGGVRRLEDLAALPITEKQALFDYPEAYRAEDLDTALVQKTSGTTGKRLEMHRSSAEVEFIHGFFSQVLDRAPGAQQPICVNLVLGCNGPPLPVPYPGPSLSVDLTDPAWIERAETLAAAPWLLCGTEPRPAVVAGLESQLRILTLLLAERGFDWSRSAVRSLVSCGDLLTARLRRLYETTWGVPVHDRYGMTEIFGGASPCPACSRWHFDCFVVPEAVDLRARQPIRRGVGALLLTSLVPFVQKQPLVRYWTGDLVELHPGCPVDDFGFSIKGRLVRSVVAEEEAGAVVLLTAADVYDALDDFPEVASSEMFRHVPVRDHSALGHLKFRLESSNGAGRTHVRLLVELRHPPEARPEHTRALLERIRGAVIARHPELASRLHDGSVEFAVEASPPGTLTSFLPDEVE